MNLRNVNPRLQDLNDSTIEMKNPLNINEITPDLENKIEYPTLNEISSSNNNYNFNLQQNRLNHDFNNTNNQQNQNLNVNNHQNNVVNNYIPVPTTSLKNKVKEIVNNLTQDKQNVSINGVNLGDLTQFKSTPVYTKCPHCSESGFTNITRKINYMNLLCCCVCTTMPWVIFQSIRNKDINCQDAEHYCSNCNRVIVRYESC
jgi:hypothetical protein